MWVISFVNFVFILNSVNPYALQVTVGVSDSVITASLIGSKTV
jgi:hypothetical protein